MKHISVNDNGTHHCPLCGSTWQGKEIRKWWPPTFKLAKEKHSTFFSQHSYEVCSERPGVKVFARVIRIWKLLIILGKEYKSKMVCLKGGWYPAEDVKQMYQHVDRVSKGIKDPCVERWKRDDNPGLRWED